MEKRVEIDSIDNLPLVILQTLSIDNEVEKIKELELRKKEAKEKGITNSVFNSFVKAMQKHQQAMALNETARIDIGKASYELPPGYKVFDGAIYYIDKAGKEEVCNHPIAIKAKAENVDTGATKLQLVWKRDGNYERNTFVDAEVAANKSDIIKLAKQNIDITSVNARGFVKFLRDYQYYHEDELPQVKSVGRCGWLKLDAMQEATEIFAPYYEEMYFDGEDRVGRLFNAVNTKKGNVQTALEALKKFRQGNSTVKLVIAASLASVLIKKVGGLPFILHLWGGTGIGKTIALQLAASIWGEHHEYVKNFNATRIGLEQVCVFLNNLPLIIDELQIKRDNKDFDNIIHTLTEGSGRTRSQKTGGLQVSESWCNTVITSGEMPISKSHSGGGVMNRVLEIECGDEDLFEDFDEVIDTINENYGLIGRLFVEVVEGKTVEELKKRYSELLEGLRESDKYTEKQYRSAAFLMLADDILECELLFSGDSLTYEDIYPHLTTQEEVDVNQRAYGYLMDIISMNLYRFHDDNYQERWGKIQLTTNTICVARPKFSEILKEGGFEERPFRKWLGKKGLVIPGTDEIARTVSVGGEKMKCICLKRPSVTEE